MKRCLLSLLLVLMAAPILAQPLPSPDSQIPYWGVAPNEIPERLALVVGVEYYDESDRFSLPRLQNATTDAVAAAKLAKKFGVKKENLILLASDGVTTKNISRDAIEDAVTKIRERAQAVADSKKRKPIIIFYFAGHGVQYDNKNFLIPSDFAPSAPDLIPRRAIDLDLGVVRRLANNASLLIVVVDACRSPAPPFPDAGVGIHMSDDPVSKGSVAADSRVAFLFATMAGEPSEEIAHLGGRFTAALITAVGSAYTRANPSSPSATSLHDIYASANNAMHNLLQKPDWREFQEGGFAPFPTVGVYKAAQQSYDSVVQKDAQGQLIEPNNATDLGKAICNLDDYLNTFSYFSYFAQEASSRLAYLKGKLERSLPGSIDVQTLCSQRADVAPGATVPSRSFNDASWDRRYTQVIPGAIGSRPAYAERTRLAQATDVKSDAVLPPPPPPSDLAAGSVQNDPAASAVVPVKQGPGLPASANVTVGDVREAAATVASRQVAVSQLDADVPLDRAVVARTSLNIRAAPSLSAPVLTAVSEGVLLELVEPDQGNGWVKVRHPQTETRTGTGFVDATLVTPALAKLSKLITFEKDEYGISDATQKDIVTTFALLGGVAISNALVEFPRGTGIVGFARAATVADFLQRSPTTYSTKERADLVVRVREEAGDEKVAVPEDSVRLTITALALNKGSRAALANRPAPKDPVVVGVEQRPARDPNSPGTVDLKLCSADSTQCGTAANVPRDVKAAVQEVLRDTGKSVSDLQKVAPMIKF
ncbi:MAG TPA: caspase family protein [Pseudolabrys sp.]|nr:caspase family protein [Pseudolabrys sp.]